MCRKQNEKASNTVAEMLRIEGEKCTKTKLSNVFSNVSFHFASPWLAAPFQVRRYGVNILTTSMPTGLICLPITSSLLPDFIHVVKKSYRYSKR